MSYDREMLKQSYKRERARADKAENRVIELSMMLYEANQRLLTAGCAPVNSIGIDDLTEA